MQADYRINNTSVPVITIPLGFKGKITNKSKNPVVIAIPSNDYLPSNYTPTDYFPIKFGAK